MFEIHSSIILFHFHSLLQVSHDEGTWEKTGVSMRMGKKKNQNSSVSPPCKGGKHNSWSVVKPSDQGWVAGLMLCLSHINTHNGSRVPKHEHLARSRGHRISLFSLTWPVSVHVGSHLKPTSYEREIVFPYNEFGVLIEPWLEILFVFLKCSAGGFHLEKMIPTVSYEEPCNRVPSELAYEIKP